MDVWYICPGQSNVASERPTLFVSVLASVLFPIACFSDVACRVSVPVVVPVVVFICNSFHARPPVDARDSLGDALCVALV